MADDKFFSIGYHPVEMLLPMRHLDAAGFDIDIGTLSGDPVKLEIPLNLEKLWSKGFTKGTPYISVFILGCHGVLNDVPFRFGNVLRWGHTNDRYLITLCHGPACILAADVEKPEGSKFIYDGYKIVVFPDSLDRDTNVDIGYLPAKMPWYVGEELKKLNVTLLNLGITGETHQDRFPLTGDSTLASNNLGKVAAKVVLDDVASRS